MQLIEAPLSCSRAARGQEGKYEEESERQRGDAVIYIRSAEALARR